MLEGSIVCDRCRTSFAIRGGVARFVSAQNYTESFGFQWNKHRKTQLDSFTGLPISRERFFASTGWPEKMPGQLILEAGCGAGRFTEILIATEAEIFSFDFSAAVEANRENNGWCARLLLFQADIFDLPLPEASFDKVMCLGVLQHTPDPERAFRSLAARVKPGGELVVDVYRKDLLSLLQWKYFLRPITKRISKEVLYGLLCKTVPALLPAAAFLRRVAGRAGARLIPVVDYSHLGMPPAVARGWAILDTFDMYSPVYDRPQTLRAVARWFETSGFEDIEVKRGHNGVVGKGRRRSSPPNRNGGRR
jgi:SAM-dependent methyltransferase